MEHEVDNLMATIWAGYMELNKSYVSISLPSVSHSCAIINCFCRNTTCLDIADISTCHISYECCCSASSACSCQRTFLQGTPYTSMHPFPKPSTDSASPYLFLHAHLPSLRRCAHYPPSTAKLSPHRDLGLPLWSDSAKMEDEFLVMVLQGSPL